MSFQEWNRIILGAARAAEVNDMYDHEIWSFRKPTIYEGNMMIANSVKRSSAHGPT